MNAKQRRWYFSHKNGNQGIPESSFPDSEQTIRPTSGIKMTPRFIKKPKEEKVTDTIGVNVGFVHYDHSVERTFETKN